METLTVFFCLLFLDNINIIHNKKENEQSRNNYFQKCTTFLYNTLRLSIESYIQIVTTVQS